MIIYEFNELLFPPEADQIKTLKCFSFLSHLSMFLSAILSIGGLILTSSVAKNELRSVFFSSVLHGVNRWNNALRELFLC